MSTNLVPISAPVRNALEAELKRAQTRPGAAAPRSAEGFRVFTADELAALPQPTWLVDGVLPGHGLSVLYGPSGCGKTFLALDWSLCVALGRPWMARSTQRGDVLYIAAEGTAGLHQRVSAWSESRGTESITGIHFLPQAVNMIDDGDLERLRRSIGELPVAPALIVVDTLARSMAGGDENSARDVGQFIANVDELRSMSGAAVLVIHHTGKAGGSERGSSALRGAADLMAELKPGNGSIWLECSKAKDAEPFDPWGLCLDQVAGSCVIGLGNSRSEQGGNQRKILDALANVDGMCRKDLIEETGIPGRTFSRDAESLVASGLVTKARSGRESIFKLNTADVAALLPTVANAGQANVGIIAATATPLGVAGGNDSEEASS